MTNKIDLSQVPMMELAKELTRQFVAKHPESKRTDPNRVAINLDIWVYDHYDIPKIEVTSLNCAKGSGFIEVGAEWEGFNNELSISRDVTF